MSPLQFLRIVRLERARQLIERGTSVGRAAEVAGFRSALHLRRAWLGSGAVRRGMRSQRVNSKMHGAVRHELASRLIDDSRKKCIQTRRESNSTLRTGIWTRKLSLERAFFRAQG